MPPERWKQIDELLEAALKHPESERASFLDRACAGDEELRREVESLLSSGKHQEAFIDSPPAKVAADFLAGDQPKPAQGDRIAHYQVLAHLGSGGMGEVYLAADKKLGRKVAIKLLPQELVKNQQAKRRLIREAKAAAKLDHPNICTIHEINDEAGLSFIVMQYVEGVTLSSRIQLGPIDLSEALNVAAQIADALVQAHSYGIIHRDIKPANIIVTPSGQVKVLDFGLAKTTEDRTPLQTEAETASILTEPGTIVGTVPYMSPEQVKGESLDPRTDIFSFGSLLFEMLSGRLPFAGDNAAVTMSAILTQEPPPLTRYADVPAELQRIVRKCLEKDKENRYQSARELSIDLKRLMGDSKTANQNLPRTARQRDKHRLVYAATVLFVMLLFVGGGIYLLRSSRSASTKSSLAILPFTNASADPGAEFLSDGITESLINSLSRLSQLKVTARTTAFRYRGKDIDPQMVGRELNVDTILTGKVVQQGDSLFVQADLLNAADGSQLWGERYRRNLSDILVVQEEISRQISEKLRLTLTQADQRRLTKRYTDNSDAYQLYIQGRYYWNKRTEEGLKKALGYFQKAINLDPAYSLAHVGLADCYNFLGAFGIGVLPPMEVHPQARAAAMQALATDDSLAEARTSLAFVLFYYDWNWRDAESEYRQAIEADSQYALAHQWYSHLLMASGRTTDGTSEAARAQELEPVALSTNMNRGWQFYFAHEYEQAISWFKRTLELEPNFEQAIWALGRSYVQKRMFQEATRELERAVSLSRGSPVYISALGYAHAASGDKQKAQKTLEELKDLSKQRYVSPYWIAMVYAGLGNNDSAFEWLEKAYLEKSGGMVWLQAEPQWDAIRSDPRFQELLVRVGRP